MYNDQLAVTFFVEHNIIRELGLFEYMNTNALIN